MPISISCQCGKSYLVKDEFAIKTDKCSNCGLTLQIGLLYLAEVIKKRFPFGGKTQLKLLAYQKSAHNWQALQDNEIIPAEEVNHFSHGSLVLVRLNNSRQIQQIEHQTGQKLVQILRQFSRLYAKFHSHEEDILQWKQSLNFSANRMKTGQHGEIVRFLGHQFEKAFAKDEKSWVAISGLVGVRVPYIPFWDSCRVPAITILPLTQWKSLREQEATIELGENPPILVVEVIRDSAKAEDYYDLEESEWALLKISEYWIVNIFLEEITVYILEDQTYKVITYQGDDMIQSSVIPSLHLSVTQIMSV